MGAAVESYGAWRVVFEDDFSVGCVVFVFECCFSSHVGLVLSVGFVLSVGQVRRSRSRALPPSLRSVALGCHGSVGCLCSPLFRASSPREPFYLFSGVNLSQCTFER